ncbi:hypothetical protein ACLOJK_027195 [Asimina triloba]
MPPSASRWAAPIPSDAARWAPFRITEISNRITFSSSQNCRSVRQLHHAQAGEAHEQHAYEPAVPPARSVKPASSSDDSGHGSSPLAVAIRR